ncbi:MAG: transglutaminase family protein [Myxococcales bacterium]|nr:transglutaminase family protein [Myxococcales bacterium]
MKRIGRIVWLAAALVLGWTAAGSANVPDLWQLGYRPFDPFMPSSLLDRQNQDRERFKVTVSAYFIVQRNPRQQNVKVYLPLPADDYYQTVYVSRFKPAPTEILKSRYGYEIAVYDFGPATRGTSFAVQYEVEATVGKIGWAVGPEMVGPLAEIPEQVKQDYLVDGRFYRINDPEIRAAALEAVGNERHPYAMLARIVQFVHERLQYQLDGRKVDAVMTLRLGQGSCSEHSFLLIALARHLGLPMRYMSGSFYKPSVFTRSFYDRVNHKIVEAFLPRLGWVPVESTGSRHRAVFDPESLIGESAHRMLFFAHEPEPGLAPLDPRNNIFTQNPFDTGSDVALSGRVLTHWERLR